MSISDATKQYPTELMTKKGAEISSFFQTITLHGTDLKKVLLKFDADDPWFVDKTSVVVEINRTFDVIFIGDIAANNATS